MGFLSEETNEDYRKDIIHYFMKLLLCLDDANETTRWKKKKESVFDNLYHPDNYYTNPEFNNYLKMGLDNGKVNIVEYLLTVDTVHYLSKKDILSYDGLCALCDLFRLAEKCLYYKNDISTGMFYVDSVFCPKDGERKFAIENKDYTIYGKLYTRKDDINNILFKVKNIRIIHNNGKKLANDITIVNEDFRSKNEGDSIMIESVYRDILEVIYRSYRNILENIKIKREILLKQKYGLHITISYNDTDSSKFEY